MNLRQRIELLEGRMPAYDPVRASLIWLAMATFVGDEEHRRMLLAHADAVAAGLAFGDPEEPTGGPTALPNSSQRDPSSRQD